MAKNETSLLERTARVGAPPARGAAKSALFRAAAALALPDGTGIAVKRWARRGRRAAEDLLDDAAHRIRRDPLRSVAVGFVVGLGLGALLAGWRAARNAGE